jgi:hypothetical protein
MMVLSVAFSHQVAESATMSMSVACKANTPYHLGPNVKKTFLMPGSAKIS